MRVLFINHTPFKSLLGEHGHEFLQHKPRAAVARIHMDGQEPGGFVRTGEGKDEPEVLRPERFHGIIGCAVRSPLCYIYT